MKLSPEKVLILGNYRQSLTVARSLARAGYHVIVGRNDEKPFTDYSRYTSEVWEYPDIRRTEAEFIVSLCEFLEKREDVSFVFPVNDLEVGCLARNADKLPSSAAIIMPEPSVVSTCHDKGKIYEINDKLGIPQPRFQKVFSYSELIEAAKNIGAPFVIKPVDSFVPFYGKKLIIVQRAEDIQKSLPAWPEGNEVLIVQKYIRGYRRDCAFAAVEGGLIAYFERKILRTTRHDYTGFCVDGISVSPTSELRKYCEKLAGKLEYSGVGYIQFLIDETDGEIYFLEINPRLDANCAIQFHSGYDFPKMAVECVEYKAGLRPEPPGNSSSYSTGKHGVWI